jgi:hypothetical protein
VPFRVGDGVLQLGCKSIRDKPEKIVGIKFGRAFSRLYVLHATAYAVDEADVTIGKYVVHYADGATQSIPMVNGKDVCGWWKRGGAADPTHAKVAWEGTNACVQQMAATVRLFMSTWANPRPAVGVLSVDHVSAMTKCAPFCVALTAEEPLKPRPAARPLTPADLDALWGRLSADGDASLEAIEALACAAGQAVPFLAGRLRASRPAADEKRIGELIRQLDAAAFEVRDRATKDLEALGTDAVAGLRRALTGLPSPEVRGRVQHLLDKVKRDGLTTEQRRLRAAVVALEVASTAEARQVLSDVSRGAGEWLADDARAALKRIKPVDDPPATRE